jgi:hypothetical protein
MLGLLALAIVATTVWIWFQMVNAVTIPRNRAGYFALFVIGGVLGVTAISQGGFFSTAFALPAVVVGFVFPTLRMLSKQQPNQPSVAIGEDMLTFVAPDENGVDFDLASLLGKPYLLKFFRGHW